MKKLNMGVFLLFFCVATAAFAAMDEGALNFQDGSIQSVSPDQIVLLRESDDDISEEIFTFKIAPDVTLEHLKSLADLSVGDDVVIGFLTEDKDKVAKTVLLSEKDKDL